MDTEWLNCPREVLEPAALVGSHTTIPYPESVIYQVAARFENGPALITFQFVKSRSGELKAWSMNINSEAFLPQLPDRGAHPS